MLSVENVSEKNIEDVFKICSCNRSFAPLDGPVQEKGRELKRQWLLNMIREHGPCMKIAYLDEQPVAQLIFYPEELMPYIPNPRKDAIYLKCIFNSYPGAKKKGAGAALMESLLGESREGLECLGGKPCSFVVAQTYPAEGELQIRDFFQKYGFKDGEQEMFLEVKGKYIPRKLEEYRPLPEDHGRVILTYNPDCEWGYYLAETARGLLQSRNPTLQVEMLNNWERPEEYKKHPHQPLIAASTISNGQLMDSFLFWVDREAYLRNVEEALRK